MLLPQNISDLIKCYRVFWEFSTMIFVLAQGSLSLSVRVCQFGSLVSAWPTQPKEGLGGSVCLSDNLVAGSQANPFACSDHLENGSGLTYFIPQSNHLVLIEVSSDHSHNGAAFALVDPPLHSIYASYENRALTASM